MTDTSIEEMIQVLRQLIRQVVRQSSCNEELPATLALLKVVSLAAVRLAQLEKAWQQANQNAADPFTQALHRAINEVLQELTLSEEQEDDQAGSEISDFEDLKNELEC